MTRHVYASPNTKMNRFAEMSCSRYWIERALEDARGENGGIIDDDNNTILYKSNSHIDTIVFQHPIRDKMQDASS